MPSKLEQLLNSIHPAKTSEQLNMRADEALNTFEFDSALITDWNQFRLCLTRFLNHGEQKMLLLRRQCSGGTNFDWGRCCQILMRVYGPNGEKTAFEIARTGNEGGLYAVVRKIALSMAERFIDNEINAKVNTYWNNLSVEEKLNASQEYLDKFGHLLPSELTEGSAARIRAGLPKVLREHHRLIERLGRVGRV